MKTNHIMSLLKTLIDSRKIEYCIKFYNYCLQSFISVEILEKYSNDFFKLMANKGSK